MKLKVLLLALALVALSACSSAPFDATEPRLEGFLVNMLPIQEDDVAYSISKLQDFFESSSSYVYKSPTRLLSLDKINQQFPIKYLRKVENRESYYIVYPVLEGGKYLVFLGKTIAADSGEENVCSLNSIYVFNLPNEDCFETLNIGDTYSEVVTIAPYTCMPIISSRSISYSLLANGNVMQCSYSSTRGQELILENKELLTPEDSLYPFTGMLFSDLIA